MNRTTVVLIAFAASACALHQAPKENEPLDIDMAGFVGTVGGKDAARRIEFELKLLAQPPDEHTRTHFILPGPKGRAQLRAMLLVDLERAISELTAKSAADPLAVVEPYTRIKLNIARRGAVAYAPDRAAVIDELIERAAKVHDERAAAVGVGRPAAYRFHIARAMLIRGAGSLPDASNLIAPRVALRVTVEGKKCPSFAASLAKMMTSTFESKRTVEASVTLERCSVRFNESKREEALNWEEKVDGGKEHVTVRHRELCPLGRDEQDRVWCRVTETAEKELCPPQAYTRCYTQTLETVERQVVKTVARSGTRTQTQTLYTIELGGTWSASFAGKSAKGTFAEPHGDWGGSFVNAPELGKHRAVREPVLSADEILVTKGVPEVQRIVGAAALALADGDVSAKSSNPEDLEEATILRVLGGAKPPESLTKRYWLTEGQSEWDIRESFREIRDGDSVSR